MDRVVAAADQFMVDQEAAYDAMCYEIATGANGLTQEQADNCDCGHWNCCGCPFGGSEYIRDAYKRAGQC